MNCESTIQCYFFYFLYRAALIDSGRAKKASKIYLSFLVQVWLCLQRRVQAMWKMHRIHLSYFGSTESYCTKCIHFYTVWVVKFLPSLSASSVNTLLQFKVWSVWWSWTASLAIAPRERTSRTRQARRIPTTRSTVACAPTTFARLALISPRKKKLTKARRSSTDSMDIMFS